MKVAVVLFALVAVVNGYSRYSYYDRYRGRPQRYEIQNVISALDRLNARDVSRYYCYYLSGRVSPRHLSYGYNWYQANAWQTLSNYGGDKVKSCLTYYVNDALSFLSPGGRERFCELIQSISSSLSQRCEWGIISVLGGLCPDAITLSPPATLPPNTQPPTIPPVPTTASSNERACGVSLTGSQEREAISSTLISLRIVGGSSSDYGKYPFIVTVNANGLCGGTIVNSTFIMTAAHCVDSVTPSSVVIGVGEFDRSSNIDQTDYGVQSITIHPGYTGGGAPQNDIALLELRQPINYQDTNSAPVCLPGPGDSAQLTGQNCVVAGWGLLNGGGLLPNVLQEVQIPAYDGSLCAGIFNFRPSNPTTQLCAGRAEGGVDSCQGDSGGPLMCQESRGWVQYGIVSYGAGCAVAGQPGIYTDVSQYVGNFVSQ